MSKVLVNESSLSGIADAIREKNGETTTYKPSEMAAAITAIPVGGGGGDLPEEAFMLTGDCSNRFAYGGWDWFVENYGNRVNTENITDVTRMFYSSQVNKITFEITCKQGSSVSMDNMFSECKKLEEIPKINNCSPKSMSSLFYNCQMLKKIPDDIAEWFDWKNIEGATSAYSGYMDSMFYSCFSLRDIPLEIFEHVNPNAVYSYAYFYRGFYGCYSLDEIENMPIKYTATWTSNAFMNTFTGCCRAKKITFALQDGGIPCVVKWKSQTIDFASNVGYATRAASITGANSGITADKEVTDDASYQALKNDPDWFTANVAYSRYNHDSAVATINSLPDTSAYLASAGGSNTLKFKGAAGSATDGGAINTLTEAEIATAAAKGWTVTLS